MIGSDEKFGKIRETADKGTAADPNVLQKAMRIDAMTRDQQAQPEAKPQGQGFPTMAEQAGRANVNSADIDQKIKKGQW